MARFYDTQLVNPTSAYVAPPWELIQSKLNNMQQLQDQYKGQVELMDKPFGQLTNDTEGALAAKQAVQDRLEGLRKLDYNDPQSRDQIYNTIKEVRNMYSPQGEIGLYGQKLAQYEALDKQYAEAEKSDPMKYGYLRQELRKEAQDASRAIQKDPNTGEYINTTVNAPQDFNYIDKQKWLNEQLGTVEFNQTLLDLGVTNPLEAVYKFKEGERQSLTSQKIIQALSNRAIGDPNLLRSVEAEGSYYNYRDKDGNLINQRNFIDESGKLNTGTLFGSALYGTATGGAFQRDKANSQFVTDGIAEHKAKSLIDNPAPLLVGKSAQDLQLGTTYNNSSTVKSDINTTEAALIEEYKQLEIAAGKSPESVDRAISTGVITTEAIANYVNQYSNKSLTPKAQSLLSSYNNLKQLDNEANAASDTPQDKAYRDKLVTSINPIGKLNQQETMDLYVLSSKIGGGEKYTKEEAQQYINLRYKQDGSFDQKTIGPEGTPVNNGVLEQDAKHVGKFELAKINEGKVDNFKNYYNSYTSVEAKKDAYLKENSDQRLKENTVLNKNVILKQEIGADGKPTGRTIVDTDNTNLVNKQVDTYFSQGQFADLPATDQAGNKTTLDAILKADAEERGLTPAEAAEEAKKIKPWYSSYNENGVGLDGKPTTFKPMYVTVGGKPVKIDQSQIKVNYGNGLIPLNQIDQTPQAQVDNYLATTSSYGVKSKPIQTTDGSTVIINNAKTANNYANNSDLKVDVKNAAGVTTQTLVGTEAFNFLTYLQTIGELK